MTKDQEKHKDHIFALLHDIYTENPKLIEYWYITPNPLLGNVSPKDMVEKYDRGHKVIQFIEACREENQ
jgi:hypothetical protein